MRLLIKIALGATLIAGAALAQTDNKIVEGSATFGSDSNLTLTLIEHVVGNGTANYSWGLTYVGGGFSLEQKTGVSCGQDWTGKTNPSYQGLKGCTVAGQVRPTGGGVDNNIYALVTVYAPGQYSALGWAKITIYRKGAPGQPRIVLLTDAGPVTSGGFVIGKGIQPGGGL